jgi:inner membrane transporter RhtA
VFATMNLTLYTAIDRIGLALAITLEFLGPLGVALAASRSRLDLLTAAIAAVGVYVLVLPGPASDLLGLAFGLAAGTCWAAYIVLNRVVGARLPGLQAPALAGGLCALGYLPVLVTLTLDGGWDLSTVLPALAAG